MHGGGTPVALPRPMHRCLVLVPLLAACAAPPAAGGPAGGRLRPVLDPAVVAALAARPEVALLDGDVALICNPAAPATDVDDAGADCDAALVAAGGTLAPLGRGGLIGAGRLDRARLMLLTGERSLVLRSADGETVIARHVADPRLAPDRRAIAFTQLPPGAAITPGTTGRLVLLDLDRGTRRLITEHPLDSSPFPRPGGDDVLFVSGRTGVASLWLASAGRPARQVTNRGAREVGAGFVPVPGRELVWLAGGRIAVYTATYDGVATLWALDVDLGQATPLGRGRWPQVTAAGDGVVALDAGGRPFALAEAAIELQLESATATATAVGVGGGAP